MAHDVFISYSTDDKLVADAVCAGLERRRVRCWIAPRDILSGSRWGESIVTAVREARLMVLILSANANASETVKDEVYLAASRGIPILPFRIEDVQPAAAFELFIMGRHWLDAMTPPIERHIESLTRSVQAQLKAPPLPRNPWAAPEHPSTEPRATEPVMPPLTPPAPVTPPNEVEKSLEAVIADRLDAASGQTPADESDVAPAKEEPEPAVQPEDDSKGVEVETDDSSGSEPPKDDEDAVVTLPFWKQPKFVGATAVGALILLGLFYVLLTSGEEDDDYEPYVYVPPSTSTPATTGVPGTTTVVRTGLTVPAAFATAPSGTRPPTTPTRVPPKTAPSSTTISQVYVLQNWTPTSVNPEITQWLEGNQIPSSAKTIYAVFQLSGDASVTSSWKTPTGTTNGSATSHTGGVWSFRPLNALSTPFAAGNYEVTITVVESRQSATAKFTVK